MSCYCNVTQLCLNQKLHHLEEDTVSFNSCNQTQLFPEPIKSCNPQAKKACKWPNKTHIWACTCTLPLGFCSRWHTAQAVETSWTSQQAEGKGTWVHTTQTHNDKAQHVKYWPAVVFEQTKANTFPFLHEWKAVNVNTAHTQTHTHTKKNLTKSLDVD